MLIERTWKDSFWRDSPWAHRIRWPIFARRHERIIWDLLSESSVLVASDDKDRVQGYVVFHAQPVKDAPRGTIHYLYVEPEFRRRGVGKALLQATGLPSDLDGVAVSHGTRAWFAIKPGAPGLEARFPRATHDPYLAFERLSNDWTTETE